MDSPDSPTESTGSTAWTAPPGPLETAPLHRSRSFWGMALTQFLGAFNDNVYKQLMLLLAIPVALTAAAADSPTAETAGGDVQGWANLVFALPFVLFSGIAGYVSDRYRKQPIIVGCKVAEIAVMLLALIAFLSYDRLGMIGTWTVLFLMATQSAFFGPGKYGILPELFSVKDLPKANGFILMTTFLAIIFGTVIAGELGKRLIEVDAPGGSSAQGLWVGAAMCVALAVAGTLTSLLVRSPPPAQPSATLSGDDWTISVEMRRALMRDRPLLGALLASSVFWLVSGIAVPVVNRLGLTQLHVDMTQTSVLVAAIGLGIMFGGATAGFTARLIKPAAQVQVGLWGLIACLGLLGAWWAGGQHLLGYYGAIAALILLGVSAALYAIPLQVFLQSRPPSALKGRIIAVMNQANFLGILIAGPMYQLFERLASWFSWPVCSIFWMMAALLVPMALLYRLEPRSTP
jgi:MFS family permease